ncbi:ABC transporter permease [bacterium]|nr:ABC transporter permease [bacterium]
MSTESTTFVRSREWLPQGGADAMGQAPVTIIEPTKGPLALDWGELWRYRDLLYFLILRDLKVRYKQTLLGVGWAVLVPLTQMAILGVIFGKVARLPSDGLNPFLFYLAGLVPWQYFANALSTSSTSLVTYSQLLTRIYFPRLSIPIAICIANLVDFAIAFAMLLLVMLGMGILPASTIVFVPLVMGVAFVTTLGTGLLLSAMNVKYRDVKFVVPFLIQIWMYVSVVLPFSQIPENWGAWRYLYGLNPMVGVIECFRWSLLHPEMSQVDPPWLLFMMGLPVTFFLLFFGLHYFRRTERVFADVV